MVAGFWTDLATGVTWDSKVTAERRPVVVTMSRFATAG